MNMTIASSTVPLTFVLVGSLISACALLSVILLASFGFWARNRLAIAIFGALSLVMLIVTVLYLSSQTEIQPEAAANPNYAPNPTAPPWYSLGLDDKLIYLDPWLAGIAYPIMMILSQLFFACSIIVVWRLWKARKDTKINGLL